MEYKVRANIVMGRELTIEAEDLVEALEKARAMMAAYHRGRGLSRGFGEGTCYDGRAYTTEGTDSPEDFLR